MLFGDIGRQVDIGILIGQAQWFELVDTLDPVGITRAVPDLKGFVIEDGHLYLLEVLGFVLARL
ncbi:hypothetical protein D3C79_1049260 [compost metagenome]